MSSSLNAEVVTTKTRSSAKEAVSSRWATRAEQSTRVNLVKQQHQQQQQQQQQQQHPIKPRQDVNVKQQLNSQPANVICQTWKQVQNALGLQLLKYLAQRQHLSKSKPASLTNKAKKVHPRPSKKTLEKNKEQLANTLTNIRVSSALQNQLAEITKGESKNYLKSVLSILPAGFDETSALTSSIQNRKRAFMLMDLGRVIRAHAQFITVTCGFGDLKAGELPPTHKLRRMGQTVNSVGRKRKGVYIQPQFKVMKNPSLELLKLLARLGVDLRCNSSDDVLAASQAVLEERRERAGMLGVHSDDGDGIDAGADLEFGEEAIILVDDVSKTRKPDGYFRRLMQMQDATNRGSRVEVAVDSVDEVHRIANTVRRLSTRHNNSGQVRDGCNFILRLPVVEDIGEGDKVIKDGTWERLVLSVHAAAMSEESELVGVSVDLSPWTKCVSSFTVDRKGESEQILMNICTHLRLFRLLLLTVGQYHIRIDMTGLPYPFNRDHSELLTRVLKNVICSDVATEELKLLQVSDAKANANPEDVEERAQAMAEMANDPSRCSLVFTADVSDHLVQRAGALCCRIIGVKDGKAVANENPQDNSGNVSITKHFYIDDGCYGSLGSTKCGIENTCPNSCSSSSSISNDDETDESSMNMTKKHFPVPLYGGSFAPQAASRLILHKKPSPMISPSSVSAAQQGAVSNNLVQSTVWGPTCDGLDKVCDKVMLPIDLKANRDWLVFSNLGCGGFGGGLGLGTAFNGFDPPDVAYCVLGYFAHLE